MKLKMKAIGEKSVIPEKSRVYFSIQLPGVYKYAGNAVVPVFFDEKWSIGRCIDSISKLVDLPNENNKMSGRKLHMRRRDAENEEILKWDCTIADLLNETFLANGCELLLLYN